MGGRQSAFQNDEKNITEIKAYALLFVTHSVLICKGV